MSLPDKRYLYRVITLFLPVLRGTLKIGLSPLFTTCVSIFAQSCKGGRSKEWCSCFSRTVRDTEDRLSRLRNLSLEWVITVFPLTPSSDGIQGDNLFWKHAVLVFTQKSRPITFRAHCEKKQGRYFLKNDNLYRVITLIFSRTARDAENRLVTF